MAVAEILVQNLHTGGHLSYGCQDTPVLYLPIGSYRTVAILVLRYGWGRIAGYNRSGENLNRGFSMKNYPDAYFRNNPSLICVEEKYVERKVSLSEPHVVSLRIDCKGGFFCSNPAFSGGCGNAAVHPSRKKRRFFFTDIFGWVFFYTELISRIFCGSRTSIYIFSLGSYVLTGYVSSRVR